MKKLPVALILAIVQAATIINAQQYKLLDTGVKSWTTRHYQKLRVTDGFMTEQPDNYHTPINYYDGNWYVKFHVIERGCGENKRQILNCIHWDNALETHREVCELCSQPQYPSQYKPAAFVFAGPGYYYAKLENWANWFKIKKNCGIMWDGKTPIDVWQMQFRSYPNCGNQLSCSGGFKYQYQIYVVAKGVRFETPEGWHDIDYDNCRHPGCLETGESSDPDYPQKPSYRILDDGQVGLKTFFVPHGKQQSIKHFSASQLTMGENIDKVEITTVHGRTVRALDMRNGRTQSIAPRLPKGAYLVRFRESVADNNSRWNMQSAVIH
jgi:hypothetical protein